MRDSITIKPEKERLVNLLEQIEKGILKIPIFQRSFIWSESQVKDLFDSILKGYPIGSVLLWRPEESFEFYRFIGPYVIQNRASTGVRYILDGSQRISSLFGVLINPGKYPIYEEQSLRKFSLYFNLIEYEFTFVRQRAEQLHLMPVNVIIDTFRFLDFLRRIEGSDLSDLSKQKMIENAKGINKTLVDYEIPYTIINGGDIKSATEIFSRVNSKGTDISPDWMLSALSYNQELGFVLSEKMSDFLDEMQQYNFQNVKKDTILNCISNSSDNRKMYFDIKVEDLAKIENTRFIQLTESTLENLKKAVEFFYKNLYVVDYKLLPYPAQLIYVTEFFRLCTSPSDRQINKLKEWFWTTSYSNYFTNYTINQQRNAFELFRRFSIGEVDDCIYYFSNSEQLFAQPFPKKIEFTSVRAKILQLFLFLYQHNGVPIEEGRAVVKEEYLHRKKDRSPGNILLYLLPESSSNLRLELNSGYYAEEYFKYMIDEANFRVFHNDPEKFVEQREEKIRLLEMEFIVSLGIES